MARRWPRWIVVAVGLLLGTHTAHASEESSLAAYRLEATDWNGLSSLAEVARGVGITLQEQQELALDALGPGDALMILYPTQPLPADALARWIERGGRMLLADDFGAAPPLLARLGLSRAPPPSGVGWVLDDNPALPVLEPLGEHRLTRGVARVAANHPTALAGPDGALIGWSTRLGLLYDMALGDGHVHVLSDPSMLVNLMLPVADNRRLLENLLRSLCSDSDDARASEGCTVHLLAGPVRITGEPGRTGPAGWPDVVDAVDGFLARLAQRQPSAHAYRLAALVLAAGMVPFFLALFPWRRGQAVAPPRVARSRWPLSRMEGQMLRHAGRGLEVDHVVASMLLRDATEPLIYNALGLKRPPPDDLGDPVRRQAATTIAARMASPGPGRTLLAWRVYRMLRAFAALPVRMPFLTPPAPVTRAAWARHLRLTSAILRALELNDAYVRRVSHRDQD